MASTVRAESYKDGADVMTVKALSVQFNTDHAAGGEMLAADNVSFSIKRGEFVCIVGPSGCGKSTVLNVLAGLIKPTQTNDVVITGDFCLKTEELRPNRRIGYMFQQDTLLPWRTAVENVALPLQLQKEPQALHRAGELLELTGLLGFGNRFPKELSGGMRKRVQMAQLLAQDPEVLLMDEPFGALDAQTRVLMQEEFLRVWERDRKTILFVTHDLTEAILLGDRILSMSARPGKIKRDIAVEIARPRSVAELVGSARFAELHRTLWDDLEAEAKLALGGSVPTAIKSGSR